LARNRQDRFGTAREMARALEETGLLASPREVGEWVERIARDELAVRAQRLAEVDQGPSSTAESQREDPEQARDDASMLRKIDRRAVAEVATEIVDGGPARASAESSGALTAPGIAEAAPRRRTLPTVLLVAALLVLALFLGRSLHPAALDRADSAPPTSTEPRPITPAPPPLPTPSGESATQPALPPAAVSPPPVDIVSPHKQRKAAHPPKTDPTLAKPKTDCAVPFTIDEHGVRIPKRQCL
jgi:eukaryotic-like serine/threonine-protein kinase